MIGSLAARLFVFHLTGTWVRWGKCSCEIPDISEVNFSEAPLAPLDPLDPLDLQLLQISNVLQPSARTQASRVSIAKPQSWNFTQILRDKPTGSFLSHLDVLVRMIGATYNTTRPILAQTPLTLTARESWHQALIFLMYPLYP